MSENNNKQFTSILSDLTDELTNIVKSGDGKKVTKEAQEQAKKLMDTVTTLRSNLSTNLRDVNALNKVSEDLLKNNRENSVIATTNEFNALKERISNLMNPDVKFDSTSPSQSTSNDLPPFMQNREDLVTSFRNNKTNNENAANLTNDNNVSGMTESEQQLIDQLRNQADDIRKKTEDIKNKNKKDGEEEKRAPMVLEKIKLTPDTKKLIRDLPTKIKDKIYGQDEIIDQVVNVIKTAFAGLATNKKKPRGAYIFAGPSGCGKTETVIQLAQALDIPLKKFAMTEFTEENDIKKLIGSPAGYVGYEDGGHLTNFVMDNQKCIILFDEIEKADPSISKILLGMLEEGVVTDNKGYEVLFGNTIFFATSNLGSEIENTQNISKEDKDEYRMNAIKDFFPIEVINRLDSVVQFNAISKDVYKKIAKKTFEGLKTSFIESHEKDFQYDEKMIDFLVDHSYDPAMGGRPAGRFLASVVTVGIVDALFEEDVLDNHQYIKLSTNKEDNIVFLDKDGGVILEMKNTKELLDGYHKSNVNGNKTKKTIEAPDAKNEDTTENVLKGLADSVTTPQQEPSIKKIRKTRESIALEIAEKTGDQSIVKKAETQLKAQRSPKKR